MPRKRDDAGKCIQAAMTLAAMTGWRNVSLYDIAEEAGLEVADVVDAVGSRHGVLRELVRRADRHMLEAVDQDWRDENVRDRLFTLLMACFDHLKPWREGLRAVMASAPGDPLAALAFVAGPGMRSMRLVLEAAGVSTAGPLGRMRARALGLAYIQVFRTFLDDDTEDLSRTMAALDRRLKRLETLAGRLRGNPFERRRLAPAESDTLAETD